MPSIKVIELTGRLNIFLLLFCYANISKKEEIYYVSKENIIGQFNYIF